MKQRIVAVGTIIGCITLMWIIYQITIVPFIMNGLGTLETLALLPLIALPISEYLAPVLLGAILVLMGRD